MKKIFGVFMAIAIGSFSLNSCDPWEDENNNPSDGGGPDGPGMVMLLKKSTMVSSNGVTSEYTYTYDGQNRLSNIKNIMNIQDATTYSEAVYQYPSDGVVKLTAKSYSAGQLQSTSTTTLQIISSTSATMTIVSDIVGDISSEITYSAPCGITKMITNWDGFNQTSTKEYFDEKCSFKEFIDGELKSTTFNDNKNYPIFDPLTVAMGITNHNPIKIEETDGTSEVISYLYNDANYPTKATHTFSNEDPDQGIMNYTETFEYQ